MMMKYSFGDEEAARAIEQAVHKVLDAGYRTADLAGDEHTTLTTAEYGDKIVDMLEK